MKKLLVMLMLVAFLAGTTLGCGGSTTKSATPTPAADKDKDKDKDKPK